MSSWYGPHAGDERRAQLLRIQRLPETARWLSQPATLYRAYRYDPEPERQIAYQLTLSRAYEDDPEKEAHIRSDADLLWTWAYRWHMGYDGYRRAVQRRML